MLKSLCRMSMTSTLPRRPPPPKLRFTVDEIKSNSEKAIVEATAILDKLVKLPSADDAVEEYAKFEALVSNANTLYGFSNYVSADADVRNASEEAEAALEKYQIDASRRVDVYEQFRKSKADLGPESNRFRAKVLQDMLRDGLALPKEKRDEMASIQKEMTLLAQKFRNNIASDKTKLAFTTKELDGVPESVLSTLSKDSDGVYQVSFAPPEVQAILRYCKVEETRKKMWLAYENRNPENRPIFAETLKLRERIAKLQGKKSFAEYSLEQKMAKTPERVRTFLESILEKSKPAGVKERQIFLDLKREVDPTATTLYAWDSNFFQNLFVEREHAIDSAKVSEYFKLDDTMDAMLKVFEELLSIRFETVELSESQMWHEDIKAYAVWKTIEDGSEEFRGYLYTDLYPRDNKYGHFAMFSVLREGHSSDFPVSSLVCNFPRPAPGKPALMYHRDVVTLFHELGHGIHSHLGVSKYDRFAGTNVVHDFVETPSQLLEYWTWQPELLIQRFAKHYETGEPMPKELAEAIGRSKNANGATTTLRQLFFGLYDLRAHSTPTDEFNPDEWGMLYDEITGLKGAIESKGYGSFGHIMGGYEAGYYGYLWSAVFAADIWFTAFSKDPMNVGVGRRYRDEILSRGSSRDENESLFALLGRESNDEAFLKELGV